MLSLHEVQHRMRRGMLGDADARLDVFIVADGISAADRLTIYHNTYIGTLMRALRLAYPAVRRLVGDECFDGIARQFIATERPTCAWLDAYGEGLANVLAASPAFASIPYIADVARLEWAIGLALHAADVPPVDVESLQTIPADEQARLCFLVHPSVRLLRTDYPLDIIWRAVLAQDDEALRTIDIGIGPSWLLVRRSANGADVDSMREAEWRFTADLCAGRPLQDALDDKADIDAPLLIARHLSGGVFAGFRVDDVAA